MSDERTLQSDPSLVFGNVSVSKGEMINFALMVQGKFLRARR